MINHGMIMGRNFTQATTTNKSTRQASLHTSTNNHTRNQIHTQINYIQAQQAQ